jgi:hypothetical protein
MCDTGTSIERVKLVRCPHGKFHLNLGGMSLHLSTRELLLIGQAVNRWIQHHPETLTRLDEEDWHELDRRIWFG